MSVAAVPRPGLPGWWTRVKDLILPIAMVASVLVIVVPMPAGMMDLLLACNITIAVIMLLTTLFVRTPLEFSVFPSLLLATTLFRLVLNVATTRLILGRAAADGLDAAGGVVRTFGEFVTGGGNEGLVVGLIIFSIIVLIQFVVITKGATRISEVAARFTLDGMPGKQMAIDADLSAGSINEREAQRRRAGDHPAGRLLRGHGRGQQVRPRRRRRRQLIIILINIVGGLFIGIVQNGMGLGEAASLFTTLTIGDGLVTQVPAFLISLAAGMLVTRSSQESNLPSEFLRQLFSRPLALAVAGGFLAVLIFTSLPTVPLLADRRRPVWRWPWCCCAAKPRFKPAQVKKQAAGQPPSRATRRGLSLGRSDGIGIGHGPDPAGRHPSRRRSARAHPAGCGRPWPPKSASSCRRSACATTCGSTSINIASKSPTCRWPRARSTPRNRTPAARSPRI